jgi:hypothetical protein
MTRNLFGMTSPDPKMAIAGVNPTDRLNVKKLAAGSTKRPIKGSKESKYTAR